jgi:hypothetical protein
MRCSSCTRAAVQSHVSNGSIASDQATRRHVRKTSDRVDPAGRADRREGPIAAILIRNRNLSEAIPRCTRLVACPGAGAYAKRVNDLKMQSRRWRYRGMCVFMCCCSMLEGP